MTPSTSNYIALPSPKNKFWYTTNEALIFKKILSQIGPFSETFFSDFMKEYKIYLYIIKLI